MRVVEVALAERAYPVMIGRGILDRLHEVGEIEAAVKGREVFAVSDRTVHARYGERFERSIGAAAGGFRGWAVFEPGEENKTVDTLRFVWDRLVESGLDRGGVVAALGGGVVGDVAGFAAATYLRGVRFLQVPTTLLAMVDSSVGGKTGVDHPLGKNLLGAFHQPMAVAADLEVLRTLPRREVLGGLAEVIKAAVLADPELFSLLERKGPAIVEDAEALEEAVARAVAVKAKIVARDERESGPRALLNLGHTVGHAVEVAAGYGRYSHGEAVALGMAFAVRLARAEGEIEEEEARRILALLEAWDYPRHAPDVSVEKIRRALCLDKKRVAGSIRWVLPRGVGRAVWDRTVDGRTVDTLLEEVAGR
jgi:3-dehydroquinate synthase